jgi:hypothetical protein
LFVRRGELLEQFVASGCKQHIDLSAVAGRRLAGKQPLCNKPIDQPYSAMMPNLKSLGQLADRDSIASGETLYCQQRLMLLWLDTDSPSRLFAEAQKLSQRIAKGS